MPKIRFKYNHWLPKRLGVAAITLYPFVLFAEDEARVDARIKRHEHEHVYQIMQVGWIRFYISYMFFYLALRARGRNHFDAYWEIPWEVEAREAESDVGSWKESLT